MKKTVVELFAGVGGFRVGFNDVKRINKNGKAIEKHNFSFLWANQWEPSTKAQQAFDCYKKRFQSSNTELSNEDISTVDKSKIPDHSVLVGGFPCQDYSVAHSLKNEKGIEGKKGVLWWQINETLKVKKSPFVLLENVDRLLKAPSKQRGQAFGIMLKCFYDLNYNVEWRVINAADYGFPQKRRRVFIFAYKNTTTHYQDMSQFSSEDIILKNGMFAKKFPAVQDNKKKPITINITQYKDLVDVSDNFKANFLNSGYMCNGIVYTIQTTPVAEKIFPLSKLLEEKVDNHFFLTENQIKKFEYLRGHKKIERKGKNGFTYFYSEGAMSPYDYSNQPARTMLTSEGTINRSTHITKDLNTGNLRLLTPVECERINQFPDNWTNTMNEKRRYFMMGNALVCGIVNRLSKEISAIIDKEP